MSRRVPPLGERMWGVWCLVSECHIGCAPWLTRCPFGVGLDEKGSDPTRRLPCRKCCC
jgi:hypothetical protein